MSTFTNALCIAAFLLPVVAAKLSADEQLSADSYAMLLVRGEDPGDFAAGSYDLPEDQIGSELGEEPYPHDEQLVPAEEPGVIQELAHWRAIVDSVPGGLDRGQVTSSWASNLEKAKHGKESAAAKQLAFDKKVYNQRLFDKMATAEQLSSIHRAVESSLAADAAAVAAAKSRHIAVHKAAAVKMARASQAAEAHKIKEAQAKRAALEGQLAGEIEGAHEAAAQRAAWNDEVAAGVAERRKAAVSAHAAEDQATARAAVNARTGEIEAAEKQAVANAAAAARLAEAHSASAAALKEDYINGDEDKKNTYIMHGAELSADSDLASAKSDQEFTDQASIGEWPAGQGGWWEEHR